MDKAVFTYYMESIKSFFLKLFRLDKRDPKEAPEGTVKEVPVNKTIKKVESLKKELHKVKSAYDKHVEKANNNFNNADIVFKEYYDGDYRQALRSFHNGSISTDEYKANEKELAELREAVYEAGSELDKLQEYKKEDVLQIVGQLQALKDDYVQAVASESEAIYDELINLKKEYIQKVNALGTSFTSLVNIDRTLDSTFHEYGFSYDETMLEKYSLLTSEKGKEVKPETFTINENVISYELSKF